MASTLVVLLALLATDPPLIFQPTGVYAVSQQPVQPADDYRILMFTASWCGPCRNYKTSGKLDRLKAHITVVEIDIDKEPQWYSGSVPKFSIAKGNKRIRGWAPGAIEPDQIIQEVEKLRLKDAQTND